MPGKEELVEKLKREGYLSTPNVIRAFMEIHREDFMAPGYRDNAYLDTPMPIGNSQTISAPHMVAMMTELIRPEPGNKVLEVGGGSGYQAAVLSRLVRKIYSIELDPMLVSFARSNLKRAGIGNVEVLQGDGSRGYTKAKPYDRIMVTCATPEIFDAWIEQLRPGGIILAPVGAGFSQELVELKKTGKGIKKKSHGGCVFVPLRHH